MRYARELLTLCFVSPVPDIGVLWLILTGPALDGVVHNFEEVLLNLGLGASSEISILCDVGLEPA